MATEKRLIDANDALERLEKAEEKMMVVSMVGCKAVPMHGVIEFIKTRPTVDAVEVVRCKDCEDCVAGYCAAEIDGVVRLRAVKPDDFCAWGERKDNG